MLGLAYAFGQWDVHRCIGRIRPVFKDVLVPGYSDRVMAKPGYAVGGINLEASPYFAGFQIIFMRLDGKRLKPNDSYTSNWIRAGTEKPTESATYRSDGKLVIGIHGYAGAITNTMGLIYQLEGNEGPSVASPADGSQPANTGIDRSKANALGRSGPASKGNQKAKGDVMVQWGGTWFSATILKTENGKSLVHYDDWGSNWDEWVTPNRIKKK